MFCGPETADVSRREAEGNIDSRGSTKHTAFPRSQSISILLYTKSQRNAKNKANFIQNTGNILLIFKKTLNLIR